MKTFEDLEFKPALTHSGIRSKIFFENGYGVSVIQNEYSYGGKAGLYELVVLLRHEDGDYSLCYDTPITDDVLGWLSPQDVTDAMIKVQQLPVRKLEEITK